MMKRRIALLSPLALSLAGAHAAQPSPEDAVARLRQGGCALLLRHASTEPGIGDPSGFRLGICTTQRNLSPAGRLEAQRLGAWFTARQLVPAAVRSSAWCRCQDTATLAFGRADTWGPINSLFGGGAMAREVEAEIGQRLGAIGAGRFEVWVTHQVTISALIGEYTSMGKAWLIAPDSAQPGRPRVIAQLGFDA